ncbi:MAG TPA: glycerol-3-phosphate dehydrogenase/oxidase [Candidatus Manganitrophaceae bacterium]|nr:glycerol-3-phosphate dehydrogenase/oxidase [Candidatus Manganitrophaceae bacterium]
MPSGLDRLQTAPVDLAIIGGGIQGAGMAREAALRGLSVALFEKGDFASGTSSRTSRLIHGGIRYLEQGAFRLVHEAVHERFLLTRIAPHLVRPIPFLFPIYKGEGRGRWKIRVGMFLYDLLAGSESIGRREMLDSSQTLSEEPALRAEGLVGAARFYDCQMDDSRLCLTVLLSAREAGAAIFNYTAVTGLILKEGKVLGARVEEAHTGARYDIYARVVVNAAGPWVDQIRRMEGEAARLIRPTKGIHLVFPKITRRHAVVVESPKERRIFFVLPWGGQSLIGTTDTDYGGDLDHVRAESAEVEALLRETGRIFPRVRLGPEQVVGRFAGVRPLISPPSGRASDVSREGKIEWTVGGMMVMAGGKYTLFRGAAQKGVEAILKARRDLKARERPPQEPPLYGGEMGTLADYLKEETPRAQERYHLGAETVRYLIGAYGTKYQDVLSLSRQSGSLLKPLTPLGFPLLAEAVYAVRMEMAKRLSDFMRRRTSLALTPYNRSPELIDQVAAQMGKELGWSADQIRKEVRDYLEEVE